MRNIYRQHPRARCFSCTATMVSRHNGSQTLNAGLRAWAAAAVKVTHFVRFNILVQQCVVDNRISPSTNIRGGRKHYHHRHTVDRVCESSPNPTKQKTANPQRTTRRYEFIFTNQKHLTDLPVLLANADVNRNALQIHTRNKLLCMRPLKHILCDKGTSTNKKR